MNIVSWNINGLRGHCEDFRSAFSVLRPDISKILTLFGSKDATLNASYLAITRFFLVHPINHVILAGANLAPLSHDFPDEPKIADGRANIEAGLAYSTPCAIMARATLRNPATLAPLT